MVAVVVNDRQNRPGRTEAHRESEEDSLRGVSIVLDYMTKHNVPLTRQNYLAIAYLGDPPDALGAEGEAEIPEEIRSCEPDFAT